MASVSSITSNEGITWNFAALVQTQQYLTGDHCVLGPVQVSSISPTTSARTDGSQKSGSMMAYDLSSGFQGLDELATFHVPYASALNAENFISQTTPITLNPGDRLISVSSARS